MTAVFNNPFEAGGRWFKGNLHTHSIHSDGNLTVKQLTSLYQSCGYDFLSITDHGMLTMTRDLSTSKILLIPGEEICVGRSGVGTLIHVVAINIPTQLSVKEADPGESPQRVIDIIRGLGGEAVIAHPYWSGLTFNELLELDGYLGLEVYNTVCDLHINRGLSRVHWDNLLSTGRNPLGFASDDAHSIKREGLPSDSCHAWINVKAESLTVDHIMSSIRKGLYYSSTGPEIKNIHVGEDEISVSTSPSNTISFVSNAELGERHTAADDHLEEAVYSLRGRESYVRIEASNKYGHTAWSNAIFI